LLANIALSVIDEHFEAEWNTRTPTSITDAVTTSREG